MHPNHDHDEDSLVKVSTPSTSSQSPLLFNLDNVITAFHQHRLDWGQFADSDGRTAFDRGSNSEPRGVLWHSKPGSVHTIPCNKGGFDQL